MKVGRTALRIALELRDPFHAREVDVDVVTQETVGSPSQQHVLHRAQLITVRAQRRHNSP